MKRAFISMLAAISILALASAGRSHGSSATRTLSEEELAHTALIPFYCYWPAIATDEKGHLNSMLEPRQRVGV